MKYLNRLADLVKKPFIKIGKRELEKRNLSTDHYKPIDALYIAVLKKAHNVAKWIENLNSRPFEKYFLGTLIALLFVLLYYLIYWIFDLENGNAVRNGFFIAPLITLMITHQERLIERFMEAFDIDDTNKNTNVEKPDLEAKEIRLRMIYLKSAEERFSDIHREIWKIIEETYDFAVQNRKDLARKNAQTMLLAAMSLIIGYLFYILSAVPCALFFLALAFCVMIERIVLGIRTILKFHLIKRVSSVLKSEIESDIKKSIHSQSSACLDT